MDWKLLFSIFALAASVCSRPIALAWDYIFDNKKHVRNKLFKWIDFILSYIFPLISIVLFWFMPLTKASIFTMASSISVIFSNLHYSVANTHSDILFSVLEFLKEKFGYKHNSDKYPL